MKKLSMLFTLVITLSLIFSAIGCGTVEPAEIEIDFYQMDFNLDGATYKDTDWGSVDFTFTGEEPIMYFNLAVNGGWQVQNVPVLSIEGVGVRQSISFAFDLGVPSGTDVTSLNYGCTFTDTTIDSMPDETEAADVFDWEVVVSSGAAGEEIPALEPAKPLVGGAVVNVTICPHANFPNQECGLNECVPAAVSNSLKFLNKKHKLELNDNDLSIAKMKEATKWEPDGCWIDSDDSRPENTSKNAWWQDKKAYMESNNISVTTRKITDVSKLAAEIDAGQDIELQGDWHTAAVVGITALWGGWYGIDVAHDTKQGQNGGTKTETIFYDPSTKKFTGSPGFFDGSSFRYAVVECPAKTDIAPPTTTKVYGQPYYTDGVGQWITADTEISLDATDDDSGVDYTKYRVWYNGEWTDWLTYTDPFTMGEIGTEKDCLHKIEYYSVDNEGNEESWHEVMVEADAAELEAYSALAVDPFALRTTHVVYTEEGSQDLVYETSSDFGETWTGKTVLVSGLAEASEPDIAMAPNGDIHIVFVGYLPGQQQRISHIWYDLSANGYGYDNATDPANWEDRVLVDDTGRDNVYPQIATDSLDGVHCVWIGDSDGVESDGAQDIFYSRFDGSGWSPRLTLYDNATTTPGWPNPQVIADLYDDLHVVFLDSNENTMKYLTYHAELEKVIEDNGSGGSPSGEWGSYHGGSWNLGVADNVGGSSASYGTVAGMAVEGDILHVAWQDVRNGDGEVYENTRDITTSNAFGPEWQITSDQYTDDDGTSVGETLMESGMSDNLHLFYRDSVGYDIWYMEYYSTWSQPVKVADSGAEHMHLWSEMTVDNFDSPLLTYTKATNDYTGFDIYSPLLTYTKSTNDYTECDICYRKPYHNQIVFVDNTPPTTTKKVSGGTITLEGRDNCQCKKYAVLVEGPRVSQSKKSIDLVKGHLTANGFNNITHIKPGDATPGQVLKKLAPENFPDCCLLLFYYVGHGSGWDSSDNVNSGGREDSPNKTPGDTMHDDEPDDAAKQGDKKYDEDLDLKDSDLFDDELATALCKIKCCDMVVILDSCYSGGFIHDVIRESKKNKEKKTEIFTGADETSEAYAVPGDHTDFTKAFFKHLGDCGSLQEAFKRTKEEFKKRAKKGEKMGNPQADWKSDGIDPKYLYCCGVGSYKIHYRISYDGEWGPEQVGELNEPVSFELTGPGEYIIEYWAVDDLGNEEEHHSQSHTVEEVVHFTCPILEAIIREITGIFEGPIYPSDLEVIKKLDASESNITDITGLELCTNLTELYLGDNQISDISPLANLTNLTGLDLWGNQISDISPLANLTSLTELNLCCGNQISDISPLANLTSLTELGLCCGNQISDISPLANLTSLTELGLCCGNQISDISPLVQNEGLGTGDYIDLWENPLSSDSVNIYIPQLEARGVTVVY